MKRRTSRNLCFAYLALVAFFLIFVFVVAVAKIATGYKNDHFDLISVSIMNYYLYFLAILFPAMVGPQFISVTLNIFKSMDDPETYAKIRSSSIRFILWDEFFEREKFGQPKV